MIEVYRKSNNTSRQTLMEITVMSKQTIKPSSPTPPHFKHLKPSIIDQHIAPIAYARMLLLYSSQGDAHRFQNTNMSDRLKTSLSEVLTEYYPLAGRFKDIQSVDCSDDGLEYIEARVKAPLTLDQLVASPGFEDLFDQLLPCDAYNSGTGFKGLSAVQVTIFDGCGGMAIGVSVSHVLADASTLATFINRWAAIARGGNTTCKPNDPAAEKFTFASVFPPREIPAIDMFKHEDTEGASPLRRESADGARKFVTRRFIFPQFKIDTLKGNFEYQSPTRAEVVSALIFKCLINVSGRTSKPFFPGIVVDLRTRATPPLPVEYIGNMALLLMMKQIGPESLLNDLGVQIRNSIKEIDNDYLKRLQANNASQLFERLAQFTEFCMNNDARRIFAVSSCSNFPFHGVDFGWGAPALKAPVIQNNPCAVLFSHNGNGGGIEAWLSLEEDDMVQFQSDGEFLDFTSPGYTHCKL